MTEESSLDGHLPELVFGLLCLAWGAAPVAIRFGLRFFPPFFFGGIRFLIAWSLVTAYALATRTEFPRDGATWRVMLFLSLSQTALPMTLIFWAQQYVIAGLSSVLYATMPFFVAIFAHFFASGERLSGRNLLGMLLSFAGVVMLFSGELSVDRYSFLGGLALVVAAAASGCGMAAGKKYSSSINTTANITVQMGVGALILTTAGILFESNAPLDFNLASIVTILYLVVIGSLLGFAAMYWLFRHMEATRVSLLSFITPIVAIVLGWLILGEQVDLNAIVSSSLIILGLMVSKQAGQRHLLRITPT